VATQGIGEGVVARWLWRRALDLNLCLPFASTVRSIQDRLPLPEASIA
jgi:hypothetical protein